MIHGSPEAGGIVSTQPVKKIAVLLLPMPVSNLVVTLSNLVLPSSDFAQHGLNTIFASVDSEAGIEDLSINFFFCDSLPRITMGCVLLKMSV